MTPAPRPPHWIHWLLLTLTVGALGLSSLWLPPVDEPVWQQTHQAMMARNYADQHLPLHAPAVNWLNHPHIVTEVPLYAWTVSWLYAFLGSHEWLGRLLSLLAFLAAALALERLLRTMKDSRTSLLGVALFAVSPAVLSMSRAWLPDMLTLALMLWALVCLVPQSNKDTPPAPIPGALLFILACLSLPVVWLCGFVVLLMGGKNNRHRTTTFVTMIGSAIVVPASLVWINQTLGNSINDLSSAFASIITASLDRTTTIFQPLGMLAGSEGFAWWMLVPFLIGIPILLSVPRWRWLISVLLLLGLVQAAVFPGDIYRTASARLFLYTPMLLVAGLGLGWITTTLRLPLWLALIAVLGSSYYSVTLLHERGVYQERYPYYDEAIHLRDTLPEDAPLIVRDELSRLPEFFYFVNRTGYAIQRGVHDFTDDAAWIEERRAEGAIAYIGLTESFANNPIRYLQGHLTGTWLWSHYTLSGIGYRHFVVRLDQPREPSSAAYTTVIDYHDPTVRIKDSASFFDGASKSLWQVNNASFGRLELAPADSVLPVTQVLPAFRADHTTQPANGIPLGVLEPGRYRISIELDVAPSEPFTLRVATPEAYAIAARSYSEPQLPLLHSGTRPEAFVFVMEPTPVFLYCEQPGSALTIRSWVCLPDLECLAVDQQFEAESLFTRSSRVVHDPTASGEQTLWGYTTDVGDFIAHGGFFQWPDGIYSATFRVREPSGVSQGDLQVGLYENALVWQSVRNFGTPWLSATYTDLGTEARVRESFNLETRAFIHPNSEVMLDTIRIRQRKRDSWNWQSTPVVNRFVWRDQFHTLRTSGLIINNASQPVSKVWNLRAPIAAVNATPNVFMMIDQLGHIYNAQGSQLARMEIPADDPIQHFKHAPDTDRDLVVLASGSVLIRAADQTRAYPMPLDVTRIRDSHVVSDSAAYLLMDNGHVLPVGDAPPITRQPDFGFDAARALIPWNEGLYVVDCTGAIHAINDAPPIPSPHYRAEDWIAHAWPANENTWHYITRAGELLPIHFDG